MGGIVDAALWLKTRVCQPRIALLYLLLLSVFWAASYASPLAALIRGSVLMLALLITFRLWDDLADRHYDQTRDFKSTNQRILLTTRYIIQFNAVVVTAILLLAIVVYQSNGRYRLFLFVSLCVGLLLLYQQRSTNPDYRFFREILVLLKYPMFILVIVESIHFKTMAFATALYALLLISFFYEHKALNPSQ